MKVSICLVLAAALCPAETAFDAVWRKTLRPDRTGVLTIGDDGLAFRLRGDRGRELRWSYENIQHLERVAEGEVAILSYEDSVLRLGRDREYRFALVDGGMPDALFADVAARIGKPATDRVVRVPAAAALRLPAKRMARLGASEGTLHVTREEIVYASAVPRQSRRWQLGRDVATVWSVDPYRLEIHVFQGGEGALRRPKVFRFALKRPLEAAAYRDLKMRLYELGPSGFPRR